MLAGLVAPAAEAEFETVAVEAFLEGAGVRAETSFDLSISEEAEAALDNGITLVIVLEAELYRERRLLWDERVASGRWRFELQYHALTNRYIVSSADARLLGTFRTSGEALDSIGRGRSVSLDLGGTRTPARAYRLAARARLDIESLPQPLRLLAYLSPSWRLSSPWTEWIIER